ncbi:hypothetical protein C8J57DRAFT_1231792 [Mycena rebaudengoi]|nr:hypothetical protein C8J57DRAFT_1231792 [Mycena rebaudengoi]
MDDLELDKIPVQPPPVAVPEPPEEGTMPTWRPWYSRCDRRKVSGLPRREIVAAADDIEDDSPPLVLPYPPTDGEKYIYVQTRRTALYICGMFAFLALSVDSWFFSLISAEFYWCTAFYPTALNLAGFLPASGGGSIGVSIATPQLDLLLKKIMNQGYITSMLQGTTRDPRKHLQSGFGRRRPPLRAAIVQTPQFFRACQEQTWVERGGGPGGFFRVVQLNQDRWGAAACVGSNALYRREALKEIGGATATDHSEDLHSGFQMMKRGWEMKCIPLALACGASPDTAKAYFSQQMRWCSSSTTLVYAREFWASNLRIMQKLCFLSGLLY